MNFILYIDLFKMKVARSYINTKAFVLSVVPIALMILLSVSSGIAGTVELTQSLNKGSMNVGATIKVKDPTFTTSYAQNNYYTKVALVYGREDRTDLVSLSAVTFKITYTLTFYDDYYVQQGASVPENTLEIAVGGTSPIYQVVNLSAHNYGNVKLTIDAITSSNLSNVPTDVRLELTLVNSSLHNQESSQDVGYKIADNTLYWSYIKGCDSYQVEWVFIDDQNINNDPTSPENAFDPQRAYYKEPVRINTVNQHFVMNNTYPDGKIYFRVRGVGKFLGTGSASLKYTPWQCLTTYVTATDFEPKKNWQYVTTYNEDGEYKKVMSYMDGSMRSRQVATNMSTDNLVMVGETKYDYEGRPVVNILPVPVTGVSLAYQNSLNVFTTPTLGKASYDNSNASGPEALQTTSGASRFYSANNNLETVNRNYIPSAEGYPYTQTEYTQDGTGRVARQGGLGDTLHLKAAGNRTDKSIKYFYTNANETELHRLFGTNVGNSSHYDKNIVIDPNGQASISYLDMQGRTIATALAGAAPKNLNAIDGNSDNAITVSLDQNNIIEKTGFTSKSVSTIMNLAPTTYLFNYSLKGIINKAEGATVCKECTYDLIITIRDPYGNDVTGSPIKISDIKPGSLPPDCGSDSYDYGMVPKSFSFTEIGNYTVTKELKLSQGAITTLMSNMSQQNGYPQLQKYIDGYMKNVDYSSCDITCEDHCLTQVLKDHEELSLNDPDDVPVINGFVAQCVANSCGDAFVNDIIKDVSNDECASLLEQMKAQVSPGGYYYKDNIDGFNVIYNNAVGTWKDADNNTISKPSWSDVQDPAKFVSQWADILVLKHPEYCHYTFCQNTRGSDKFDKQLGMVKEKAIAVSKGYMPNPLAIDPYFNGGGGSSGSMHLTNYFDEAAHQININGNGSSTEVLSLQDYVACTMLYGRPGSPTPDEQWQMFRSIYLGMKMDLMRDQEINQCGAFLDDPNAVVIDKTLPHATGDEEKVSQMVQAGLQESCQGTCDANGNQWMTQLKAICNGLGNENDGVAVAHCGQILGDLLDYCSSTCGSANPYGYILKEDLASNTDLSAIQTTLQTYGCSLNDIAIENPYKLICNNVTAKSLTQCTYQLLGTLNQFVTSVNKGQYAYTSCPSPTTWKPQEIVKNGNKYSAFFPLKKDCNLGTGCGLGYAMVLDDRDGSSTDFKLIWSSSDAAYTTLGACAPASQFKVPGAPCQEKTDFTLKFYYKNGASNVYINKSKIRSISSPTIDKSVTWDDQTVNGITVNIAEDVGSGAIVTRKAYIEVNYGAPFITWKDDASVSNPKLVCVASSLSTCPLVADTKSQLHLDGADDYLNCGNSSLSFIGAVTVEAWVKPDVSHTGVILSKLCTSGNKTFQLSYVGGQFKFDMYNSSGTLFPLQSGSFPVNTWTHVAGTYDPVSGLQKLYINGTLATSAPIGAFAPMSSTVPVTIGANFTGACTTPGSFFDGSIDEVRIWNIARSATEITAAMNCSLDQALPGLVGYWTMNEGSGVVSADFSGNKNAARIINNPNIWESASNPTASCIQQCATCGSGSATVPTSHSATGLSFDGVNDYVSVPGFTWGTNKNAITIEFWVKINSPLGVGIPIFDLTNSGTNLIQCSIAQNKYISWRYGTFNSPISIDYSCYLDKWTHMALVSEGNNGTFMGMYFNGELVGSVNVSNGVNVALSNLFLGKYSNGSSFLNGMIHDFRIWDRVRSQAEIRNYMNVTVPTNTPNLVGYWKLDEGSGSVVHDNSSLANNGTVSGAQWQTVSTEVGGCPIAVNTSCPEKAATAELDLADVVYYNLGDEIILNGDFSQAGGWFDNTSQPIPDVRIYSESGQQNVNLAIVPNGLGTTFYPVTGKKYLLNYDLKNGSTGYNGLTGGISSNQNLGGGNYRNTIQETVGTGLRFSFVTGSGTGIMDNVSLKEMSPTCINVYDNETPILSSCISTEGKTHATILSELLTALSAANSNYVFTNPSGEKIVATGKPGKGGSLNKHSLSLRDVITGTVNRTEILKYTVVGGGNDAGKCCEDAFSYTVNWSEEKQKCMQLQNNIATSQAYEEWQAAVNSFTSSFLEQHFNKCFDQPFKEHFNYGYISREYQYTLYYYDQAGNLVKTYPPEAVNPLGSSAFNADGTYKGTQVAHYENLATTYQYNGLNQMVSQSTPDGGITKFWYDSKGRLRLSQNAKQLAAFPAGPYEYSYTKYDDLGRIASVGQLDGFSKSPADLSDAAQVKDILSILDDRTFPDINSPLTLSYITETSYDAGDALLQENLRGRVASVATKETEVTQETQTLYSYDQHGNVKKLINKVTGIGDKTVDYDYDLISGKVNKVYYQKGASDQFIHAYSYDADARLKSVKTSADGLNWQEDAKYLYAKDGKLARVELGELKVQGMDYLYTIQGWLKGVNVPEIRTTVGANNRVTADPGKDGFAVSPDYNGNVAQDEFAYALGYFNGDYVPISSSAALGAGDKRNWDAGKLSKYILGYGLHNGNISYMVTQIHEMGNKIPGQSNPELYGLHAYTYQYDQLNRINRAYSYSDYSNTSGWATRGTDINTQPYDSKYSYDANGNITYASINGLSGSTLMDKFKYNYNTDGNGKIINNKLRSVTEQGTSPSPEAGDIENTQGIDNYGYDAIGNLTRDDDEKIQIIKWTPYGKVKEVIPTTAGYTAGKKKLVFTYDGAGNRVKKEVIDPNNSANNATTYYERDASGNVMATYQTSSTLNVTEYEIYGSSRLGKYTAQSTTNSWNPSVTTYELSNHLGNVLATISGLKLGVDTDGANGADFYQAQLQSANDYYAFGMIMPGRSVFSDKYRYGFQAQEKDEELNGDYAFKYRMHDPRIGRFWSVDPLATSYPHNSPYAFSENQVTNAVELEGLEKFELSNIGKGFAAYGNALSDMGGGIKQSLVSGVSNLVSDPKTTVVNTAVNVKNKVVSGAVLVVNVPSAFYNGISYGVGSDSYLPSYRFNGKTNSFSTINTPWHEPQQDEADGFMMVGGALQGVGMYRSLFVMSTKAIFGGNFIRTIANKTTTVLGRFYGGTEHVLSTGNFRTGVNDGGLNLLSVETNLNTKIPAEAEKFWSTINKPWLDDAIKRNDVIRFVSDPTDPKNLFINGVDKSGGYTMFGREVSYLKEKGFSIKGSSAVKKD